MCFILDYGLNSASMLIVNFSCHSQQFKISNTSVYTIKKSLVRTFLRESNSVSQLKNVGSACPPTLVRIREYLHSCHHPLLCWECEWTASYLHRGQTNTYYCTKTSNSQERTVGPLMKDTQNKGHNRKTASLLGTHFDVLIIILY